MLWRLYRGWGWRGVGPVVVMGAGLLLAGCDRAGSGGDAVGIEAPLAVELDDFDRSDLAPVLGHKPLAYFRDNCERCHGPWGAFYGDAFGEGLTDVELAEIVDEMAAGPAGAPLEGRELEGQVAFHRSLLAGAPFVVVAGYADGVMSGEVSAGSSLRLEWAGGGVAAEVDGVDWRVVLPGGLRHRPRIVAELNGVETVLDPTAAVFSHGRAGETRE